MSNKLEEARKIINEVDSKMAELFVKRMKAAEMVFEHKKEFGLPILDQKREDEIIEKNSALIEDAVLKEYYIDCKARTYKDIQIKHHSFKPIELIEIGDYVNGEEVFGIYGRNDEKFVDVDRVTYRNNEIKSIVTKEKFESMSYKVGK